MPSRAARRLPSSSMSPAIGVPAPVVAVGSSGHRHDVVPVLGEPPGEVRADETGRAGHQDAHGRKRTESAIAGPSHATWRPGCHGRHVWRAGSHGHASRMAVVGYHASHEQHRPSVLLGAAVRAAEAGFGAVSSSDHLTPWSERQGESGFAWSWLGAAMQATSRALRRGERARPALPPGDHRPGHRHPGRDVPRTACGWRSGRARRRTSTSPATAWPAKPVRNERLRECVEVIRALLRGEEVSRRRPRAGRPGPAVDPAVETPVRLIGAALSEETARWCGGWADGLITVHRPPERAAADPRRLPRGRRRGQAACVSRSRWRGRRPRTRRWPGPTTSGARTCSTVGADGRPRDRSSSSRLAAAHVRPDDVRAQRARVVRPGAARRLAPRAARPRASTSCSSTRCPASRSAFIEVFADKVLPELVRVDADGPASLHAATSGGRTASSTASMSRRSSTGDGDGIGDLAGLVERIDYLAGIGVSTLWLMPFYPTPDRDDGYDITDFYGVDPRLGTLGQFVEVVRTARRPGHAGDHRPRRQPHLRSSTRGSRSARSDPDSPYRDWYVWVDEQPDDTQHRRGLPRRAGRGVDLRPQGQAVLPPPVLSRTSPTSTSPTPTVREEIARIIGFWLELGVSGFRVDAVPFLLELDGIADAAGRRPAPLPQGPARVRPAPQGRRHPARRGQPAARATSASSSATRTATSSTSCSTSR